MNDTSLNQIRTQSKFCLDLMKRLNADISEAKPTRYCYGVIEKRTTKQNDIVRLRRELLELYKMLDPYLHKE